MSGQPVARTGPPEELPRMSFGDHLDELRTRLIRALLAVVICVFALVPFKNTVTSIYVAPYRSMWRTAYGDYLEQLAQDIAAGEVRVAEMQQDPGAGAERLVLEQEALELRREMLDWNSKHERSILSGEFEFPELIQSRGGFRISYTLVATGGLDDFWTFMAATFLFGLILASPVVVWQAWAFVAAGLYANERRVVMRTVPYGFLLLACGVLFGFFVVVPYGLFFLVKLMNWTQVTPLFTVSLYFSFLLTLTAALGLVFQTPLIMLALDRIGIVPREVMIKQWRYVILVIAVLASVLTPPDPFTMMLMGAPMVVLYGVGLLVTARRPRAAPALEPSTTS